MAVGKWETCFWFSTFPSASSSELWKCGNLACSWRDFQGPVETGGSLLLAFHGFHRPVISTALRPAVFFAPAATSFALALAFRLLIFLGVLHAVAGYIQLDDHAVMHQPIDRGRRHHGVFKDGFPFGERQIAGHQYAATLVTFS